MHNGSGHPVRTKSSCTFSYLIDFFFLSSALREETSCWRHSLKWFWSVHCGEWISKSNWIISLNCVWCETVWLDGKLYKIASYLDGVKSTLKPLDMHCATYLFPWSLVSDLMLKARALSAERRSKSYAFWEILVAFCYEAAYDAAQRRSMVQNAPSTLDRTKNIFEGRLEYKSTLNSSSMHWMQSYWVSKSRQSEDPYR